MSGILATIAAANASYSIIMKALKSGAEIKGMIGHVGKFLMAEDQLKEAVKRKKNNPITAITGGAEGDWEEFQALETIKEQRAELESFCRLYAKPGTWDRWLFFQKEARNARKAAIKQQEKEREELIEMMMMCLGCFFAVSGMAAMVWVLGKYMEKW